MSRLKSLEGQSIEVSPTEDLLDILFSMTIVVVCAAFLTFLTFKFMPDPETATTISCDPQCHVSQGGASSGPWPAGGGEK